MSPSASRVPVGPSRSSSIRDAGAGSARQRSCERPRRNVSRERRSFDGPILRQ